MAAVRPPGIADARVPCPLCGGLIHPVAGRCKHCKSDLSSYRGGRPQAAAPLPALDARSTPVVIAAAASAPTVVIHHESSQPILPPRPTGRSMAAEPTRSPWRHWPVVVILLAVAAIGVAVVIMVMPPASADSGKHSLQPPPAPEKMETNPLPPPAQADPWGDPNGPHSQVDPGVTPRHTPDPLPPDPPKQQDDDTDVFGGIVGGGNQLAFGGGHGSDFAATMFKHACTKLQSCPGVDQFTVTAMCNMVGMIGQQHNAPVSCDAGKRCLSAIDNMSCSQSATMTSAAVLQLQDCIDAVQSC